MTLPDDHPRPHFIQRFLFFWTTKASKPLRGSFIVFAFLSVAVLYLNDKIPPGP